MIINGLFSFSALESIEKLFQKDENSFDQNSFST